MSKYLIIQDEYVKVTTDTIENAVALYEEHRPGHEGHTYIAKVVTWHTKITDITDTEGK